MKLVSEYASDEASSNTSSICVHKFSAQPMITKLEKRPRSQKIDERFGLPANDVRIKAVILS